jgi:hypothetical protein
MAIQPIPPGDYNPQDTDGGDITPDEWDYVAQDFGECEEFAEMLGFEELSLDRLYDLYFSLRGKIRGRIK